MGLRLHTQEDGCGKEEQLLPNETRSSVALTTPTHFRLDIVQKPWKTTQKHADHRPLL